MMRPWQTSRKSSLRVECKEKELVALATLPVGPDDDDVRLGGSQCSLCAVSQAKMFAVALPGWDQQRRTWNHRVHSVRVGLFRQQ